MAHAACNTGPLGPHHRHLHPLPHSSSNALEWCACAAALDALVHEPGLFPLQLKRRALDPFTQAVLRESLKRFDRLTQPQGQCSSQRQPRHRCPSHAH